MEIAIIITAIIQIITLVVFFVMASNIADIKKQNSLLNHEKLEFLGDAESYCGNFQKAKELYMKALFAHTNNVQKQYWDSNFIKSMDEKISNSSSKIENQ